MEARRDIVLFAGGEIGLAILRHLAGLHADSVVNIAGVLPAGRPDEWQRAIVSLATEKDIHVLKSPCDILAVNSLWMGFSAGNSYILSVEVIQKPVHGFINFHAAPLPRYRGSAAPAFAIIEGCREFGVTFHKMVAELDAGPIVAERSFRIGNDETAKDVDSRCIAVGLECFKDCLVEFLELEFVEKPNHSDRPPYRRSAMEQYRQIDLSWPEEKIWTHVRACDWEGVLKPAFTRIGERHVYMTARTRGTWL